MELQDVVLEEIAPFFDSLGREKQLAMIDTEAVMDSSFIGGTRTENELAGLTGIRILYGFIPDLFVVVKGKYQGMHLGSKLMEKNLYFAQRHYNFLTLSTDRTEEYEAALELYNRGGFKVFYRRGNHVWMCLPFNRRGRLICKLLPFIYPVLPYLRLLYTGAILVRLYKRLFRR